MVQLHPHLAVALSKPSTPKIMLHIEGLAVFGAAITLYARGDYGGYGWLLFGLLLLAPDLAMVGYLVGQRSGTMAYNSVHSYTLPLALAVGSLIVGAPFGMQLALIWLAHIGMDRTVGYGLKYPSSFKDTHLQRV